MYKDKVLRKLVLLFQSKLCAEMIDYSSQPAIFVVTLSWQIHINSQIDHNVYTKSPPGGHRYMNNIAFIDTHWFVHQEQVDVQHQKVRVQPC